MRATDQLQIDFNQATIDLARITHLPNPPPELLEELCNTYEVVYEKKLIGVPDHTAATVLKLTSKIILKLEHLNLSIRAERNKQTMIRRRRLHSSQRGSL